MATICQVERLTREDGEDTEFIGIKVIEDGAIRSFQRLTEEQFVAQFKAMAVLVAAEINMISTPERAA